MCTGARGQVACPCMTLLFLKKIPFKMRRLEEEKGEGERRRELRRGKGRREEGESERERVG